jgi:hypothetical protein
MAANGEADARRLGWEVTQLTRKVERIEAMKLDVIVDRQTEMADDLKSLRRIVVQVGVGIVSSAVVFAFTVFALLGGH